MPKASGASLLPLSSRAVHRLHPADVNMTHGARVELQATRYAHAKVTAGHQQSVDDPAPPAARQQKEADRRWYIKGARISGHLGVSKRSS